MAREEHNRRIVVTEQGRTLPTVEILTGRGFITGKSGSGKSNTASVIAEQLLEEGFNLLIVDTEGEYYGLKERFEVLHAGADEFCDVEIGPEDAESIAEAALVENVPVILDVSGYFDAEEAERLIHDVVAHLFRKEKRERKPFLILIEEMQEYLPQSGGGTDLAKLLKRIGKRGRKRGFGICGMSQRPSSVDKDFITQCDWLVWHRLTWKNDVSIAGDVLGSERADLIQGFDAGEGFLLTDWDDSVDRVRFRRKATHDAGATPGLDSYDGAAGNGATDALLSDDSPLETAVEPEHDDSDRRNDAASHKQGTVTQNTDLEEAVADIDTAPPDSAGGRSLDDAGAGELEAAVEREQGRNRALEDEVAELSREGEPSPVGDVETERAGTDGGSRARGVIDIPNSIVSSPRQRPTPPTPPTAAEDRTGVGGTIAEIGDLSVFLLRSVGYRLRLGSYLVRRRLAGDDP
ncbi:ATP-binding protein [Halobacteriales archaeon SW_12_67_38]|nr:MAG: ATP-binding protein [Halobacteriales archaeon SW_12_67_38]